MLFKYFKKLSYAPAHLSVSHGAYSRNASLREIISLAF